MVNQQSDYLLKDTELERTWTSPQLTYYLALRPQNFIDHFLVSVLAVGIMINISVSHFQVFQKSCRHRTDSQFILVPIY